MSSKMTELLLKKSKKQTETVPQTCLQKHMNGFFNSRVRKESGSRTPKPFKNFRVSEAGYEPRVIYLSCQDLLTWADSAATYRIFANGTAVHSRWEKWIADAGILIGKEQNVRCSDPPVRGRYDWKVLLGGLPWIGELKSINARDYTDLKEPLFYHTVQQSLYMEFDGTPRGFLVYENKDTNTPKYFETKLEGDGTVVVACPRHGYVRYEELVPSIMLKLHYVQRCLEEGKAPAPCMGCSSKCKWHEVCMSNCFGKIILPFEEVM